jgi:MFS family permease
MRKAAIAPLFYFGTLASSVGTFTFNIALIAFMLKSGFHLGHASLIIGLQRFTPVAVNGLWGHFTDRFRPSLTVAFAEAIAAVSSVALLLAWSGPHTNYALLVSICVRAIVVSFQMGSRCKITKLFSDETYAGNSKHAIWLNKATQGATLFGGLLSWIIIRYFNFETAVIFDAATFLLSGAIAFSIPDFANTKDECSDDVSWHKKFSDLFRFNSRSARLDILLVIPMMGTVAYMARLAGSDQSWTGIYMATYGLAVWAAGFLERSTTSKVASCPFWIILGVSYLMLGFIPGPNFLTVLIFFVKDLAFWIVFHRISAHIQTDTPVSKIGGVMSARNCIITLILTSGEVLVGAWSGIVPLSVDSAWRGILAVSVGLVLIAVSTRKVALAGRPAL